MRGRQASNPAERPFGAATELVMLFTTADYSGWKKEKKCAAWVWAGQELSVTLLGRYSGSSKALLRFY